MIPILVNCFLCVQNVFSSLHNVTVKSLMYAFKVILEEMKNGECDISCCFSPLRCSLVQFMCGCELDTDGTKRGYWQYGYDGEDFSSLIDTAANPQAVITKNKWEANRVSQLKKSSSSLVSRHATGFYPKEVTISWQKNGQDHDEDVDLEQLLPTEDGTFQKTSTLTATADDRKKNHEILTDDSVPIGIIVGFVAAVLLLVVIGVAGYKVYQKKTGERDERESRDFCQVW
uniref:Immunoglobulin C1-set domain-containing protein n=1 Tax=Cyprinus carpio TaxID=7962 RepID=A0A8C1QB77_CYPCA